MPELAARFVGRADLVPDHVDNHRSAVVFDNDDLKPVFKREAGDAFGPRGETAEPTRQGRQEWQGA